MTEQEFRIEVKEIFGDVLVLEFEGGFAFSARGPNGSISSELNSDGKVKFTFFRKRTNTTGLIDGFKDETTMVSSEKDTLREALDDAIERVKNEIDQNNIVLEDLLKLKPMN